MVNNFKYKLNNILNKVFIIGIIIIIHYWNKFVRGSFYYNNNNNQNRYYYDDNITMKLYIRNKTFKC